MKNCLLLCLGVMACGVPLAFGHMAPSHQIPGVLMTRSEALKTAFGTITAERRTAFLTQEQIAQINSLLKDKFDSRVVSYYIDKDAAGIPAYAFFDRFAASEHPITLMVVINPDGTVKTLRILAFYDSEDYLPSKEWLARFEGVSLNTLSWNRKGIKNTPGALVVADSITENIRHLLAAFEVIVRDDRSIGTLGMGVKSE